MFEKENTILLNGEEYEIGIIFSNPDKAFMLPKMLFKHLNIKESLMDWEFKGYLDYINDFEQVERTRADKTKKNSEIFYYRMDGTDQIDIYLKPTFKDKLKTRSGFSEENNPVLSKTFLSFTGIIYDTEDLTSGPINQRTKRIYFWDKYYSKSIENITSFSSSECLKTINKLTSVKNFKDVDRAVETGVMLKYLLENKLGAPVSTTQWDYGVNKIFYVSPSLYTLNDNIEYLTTNHVSKNTYPAILNFNRFDNVFELSAYDTLFNSYDSRLKEIFSLPDSTNQRIPIGPHRAKRINAFNFGEFGIISGYKHTKMAGVDSMKAINTKSVNWYDPVAGVFHTSIYDGSVKSAKNKFKTLASKLNDNRSTPMFTLNNNKKKNITIENKYISGAYKSFGNVANGLSHTLRAALFLNDCISFSVLGMPCRTPGSFIEVFSEKDLQGVWEDRFLGAWLVVGVEHDISSATYTNNITAIKPNATENFDVPEDVG